MRITKAVGIGAAAAAMALTVWFVACRPLPEEATAGKPASPGTALPATPASQATPSPAQPASQATLSTPVLSEDEQGRVARALATGRMEMPANIALLRGHMGILPAAADNAPAFGPITPVGTTVTQARPRFLWSSRPGATTYSVIVFDERFRQVAASGALKTNTWTPRRDLPRGRVMAWQVTAISKDEMAISPAPPQPEARFMVLEAAAVARLAKERARLATEPIALGLVLAKAGLFAEADTAFQIALTDKRYDRSQVRALLARLRAR